MEDSMSMMMGPEIYELGAFVWVMYISGIFYLICAMIIWRPFRQEENELIGALFAFLIYQAINMIFMGIEMTTMNISYAYVSLVAVLIGSAYMLKFPLSRVSQKTRNIVFLLVIIFALLALFWFMAGEGRGHLLMNFILWYDIVVNGVIVGGSIIIFALSSIEKIKRKKAMAGGTGVVSCCIVANATMLSGALLTSAIFQFLAPLLIIFSIRSGKLDRFKNESQMVSPDNS